MITDSECFYCMVSYAGAIPRQAHITGCKHKEKVVVFEDLCATRALGSNQTMGYNCWACLIRSTGPEPSRVHSGSLVHKQCLEFIKSHWATIPNDRRKLVEIYIGCTNDLNIPLSKPSVIGDAFRHQVPRVAIPKAATVPLMTNTPVASPRRIIAPGTVNNDLANMLKNVIQMPGNHQYKCPDCDIAISGLTNLQQHIDGSAHAKVERNRCMRTQLQSNNISSSAENDSTGTGDAQKKDSDSVHRGTSPFSPYDHCTSPASNRKDRSRSPLDLNRSDVLSNLHIGNGPAEDRFSLPSPSKRQSPDSFDDRPHKRHSLDDIQALPEGHYRCGVCFAVISGKPNYIKHVNSHATGTCDLRELEAVVGYTNTGTCENSPPSDTNINQACVQLWEDLKIAQISDSGQKLTASQKHSKEPNASLNCGAMYYCDICEVQCTGPESYTQHKNGKHHAKKVQLQSWQGGLVSVAELNAYQINRNQSANWLVSSKPPVPEYYYCRTCDTTMIGKETYNAHMVGKPHQKKLGEDGVFTDEELECWVQNNEEIQYITKDSPIQL